MKKIKEMGIEEMKKSIADSMSKLREIRFGSSGAKSNNVMEARMLRRNVARMKTALKKDNK